MNNAELIKALRYCADEDKVCTEITNCGYYGKGFFCQDVLLHDAADALEVADKRIAELMPKEGEWQWLSSTYDRVPCEMRYVCSVCHHQEITHYDKPWKHYCPNCGARMRGEHNDER